MPYLGQLAITGPEPEQQRRQRFVDALAAATESPPSPKVLDHRVTGHPGGAAVTVVLDGDGLDFEQASAALASLGRHLTTWSPELLEYTLHRVEVSKLEQRWNENDWLPPPEHDPADEPPPWPLSALTGNPLPELAAQYLIAGAVRSVWEPGKQVNRPAFAARDVALGAAEYPWYNELTSALGTMLIQAARLEAAHENHAPLIVAEGGNRDLADDLLRRARLTADEDATDGVKDRRMRGHLLLKAFMKAHELDWKTGSRQSPRNTLLRQVLEAGFAALATMCASRLRITRSPWELTAALTDDPVVAVIAGLESNRIDEDIASDADAVWSAAASHAAVWAAIHKPDLLDTEVGTQLLDNLTDDIDTLHQVVHSALVMLGNEVIAAALQDPTLPSIVSRPIHDFVTAQRSIHGQDHDGDALDATHSALEAALEQNDQGPDRLRGVLRLLTIAAPLTATDANPQRGHEEHISSPSQLSAALLRHPDKHAALSLSQESHGDGGVRTTTLAILATLAPEAAAAMAAQFPVPHDNDPRSTPAARAQALRWIRTAIDRTSNPKKQPPPDPASPDAQLLLTLVRNNHPIPDAWPPPRLLAAAAEATATLLQPVSLQDAATAIEVFAGS